ncbi:MAG: DNA repair protein RadA [Acutalibacteraceae bacterium]|nr:DNA repair protein RadA [Acutalibacteraceae bacterium]
MSPKPKSVFICSECGYESAKWVGKCPGCNAWNTMEEEIAVQTKASSAVYRTTQSIATARPLSEISFSDEPRFVTGIAELDRVLGGGIVKGSVVLLSGDPGIGKSTILLQICNALQQSLKILYVSGEESAIQIKMRAGRIGVESDSVSIMTETDVQAVCEYIMSEKPDIVMIDSIQTMQINELNSSPGSIVQVRESTNLLLRTGKSLGIPIFIVGHVNKGGDIAGPKVMEHIVDTVLYFEGERNQSYRILRGIKNRFGSTNEIGVFEMTDVGLKEVENPSAMLLSGRMSDVSGGCITCVIEGTRPILAEVQGLVTPTGFGNARRTATGFDYNRLNLLLAVLEKRLGIYFANQDTYVNIVGGMKLDEPAADLAVAMALVSGYRDIAIDENLIAFGEIGLSGELRSVPRAQARINEAARLGFTKCILPKACMKQISSTPKGLELIGVNSLGQAISIIK